MKDFYLDSHKSAFCHVQISDSLDSVSLISYETNALTININSCSVSVVGVSNYSRSTIKHMGWFMREFLGENLYYKYKEALLEAKKDSLDYALFTEDRKEYTMATILNYTHNGKRFKGYKSTPNYEYWYYNDNSNFTPIYLRR